MQKKTRLDDDAQIYNPPEVKTEREKLKEMKGKKKLSYLWDYYKLYAIGAVAVIALIIYFIYNAMHPAATTRFYAAIVNNSIDDTLWEEYQTDFADYLQLNPEREDVVLNTMFNFNSDSTYTASMQQALSTYLGAAQVDVIIAPESLFKDYAYYGTADKLSEQLPTNIYSSLTDYFYITNTEEEDTEKDVYGIYLTDTKLFKTNADNTDPYILGIVPNSKHKENALKFIQYIFGKE